MVDGGEWMVDFGGWIVRFSTIYSPLSALGVRA
jgi:hypothetical protein